GRLELVCRRWVTRASSSVLQGGLDDVASLVDLGCVDDERRRDADDVAAQPTLAEQEPAPPRRGDEGAGPGGVGTPVLAWRHQLESLHQAHAAHVADEGEAPWQLVEAFAQPRAHHAGVADQVVLLDVLDRGQRARHRHRVAAVGSQRVVVDGGGDLGCGYGGVQRVAVGYALGEDNDVRFDSPVLDGAHVPARAAPAGLHLVDDEQAACLLDDRCDAPEVVAWRHDETADALDGLGHEGRDATFGRGADEVFEVGDAQIEELLAGHAWRSAVLVGVADVLDVAVVDAARAPARVGRHAHRGLGPAAVGVPQRDDVGAPRVH